MFASLIELKMDLQFLFDVVIVVIVVAVVVLFSFGIIMYMIVFNCLTVITRRRAAVIVISVAVPSYIARITSACVIVEPIIAATLKK